MRDYTELEDVIDRKVRSEASVRRNTDLEEEYGPLTVSTDKSLSSMLKYTFEFPEGDIEIHYKPRQENYGLRILETLSRGMECERAIREFYTTETDGQVYRQEEKFRPVLEPEGKLPSEYREPVGEALDDLFWE